MRLIYVTSGADADEQKGHCNQNQCVNIFIFNQTGYEIFLSTMVGKEVENLPRGIYYTSLRKPGVSANQGKAVSSIPSFIQTQYEKTKLPALRPELAGTI